MTQKEIDKIIKEHKEWLEGRGGKRANLRDSDLRECNLRWSDLRDSDLRECDLRWCDLSGCDLRGAYLPSPGIFLLCNWNKVSDELTIELMRYDASNHPNPKLFSNWAKGGGCPFRTGFNRSVNFRESPELWKPGKAKTALTLVLMLFKEKNIKFD